MALTASEKTRLVVVIEVAGDDEKNIRAGIIKALRDVNQRETRNYLWRTLEREARKKIRAARRKHLTPA